MISRYSWRLDYWFFFHTASMLYARNYKDYYSGSHFSLPLSRIQPRLALILICFNMRTAAKATTPPTQVNASEEETQSRLFAASSTDKIFSSCKINLCLIASNSAGESGDGYRGGISFEHGADSCSPFSSSFSSFGTGATFKDRCSSSSSSKSLTIGKRVRAWKFQENGIARWI